MDKALVKKLQIAMNEAGHTPKFAESGNYATKTEDAIPLYDFTVTAKKRLVVEAPPVLDKGDYFGAPYIGLRVDLLGRSETDKELNQWLSPEWANEGLAKYKDLIGNRHPWCSVLVNAKLRAFGIKPTNSAGASSWSKWGTKSPFWFGSVLDIVHKSGGRHVCFFLYWIDEKKKIAATMDGNRGNKYCVAQTDLSGRGDTLKTGPRWPTGAVDGQSPTMAEVLKAYPHLKVGSTGTSTR